MFWKNCLSLPSLMFFALGTSGVLEKNLYYLVQYFGVCMCLSDRFASQIFWDKIFNLLKIQCHISAQPCSSQPLPHAKMEYVLRNPVLWGSFRWCLPSPSNSKMISFFEDNLMFIFTISLWESHFLTKSIDPFDICWC